MSILPILEAPHPILSKKARPVREDEFGEDLDKLLSDMAETMYAAPGVGLAAPQIGDGRRIVVVDPGNNEDNEPRQLYCMVNPQIIDKNKGFINYEESCLSVPEFYIFVKRFKTIQLKWQDAKGKEYRQWFSEFPAIVIQHELDHLKGITLLDHSSRFKRSRYISKRRKMKR